MNVTSPAYNLIDVAAAGQPTPEAPRSGDEQQSDGALADAFHSFVGQSLFSQMLKAMRKTVGEPAYFNGGKGEEVFRQQLDQVLAEKISDACGDKFSKPMFELFSLKRM